MRRLRLFLLFTASIAILASCAARRSIQIPSDSQRASDLDERDEGMRFKLREGEPGAKLEEPPIVELDPLEEAAVAAIVARLGDSPIPGAEELEFRFPARSKPRPRIEQSVDLAEAEKNSELPEVAEDNGALEILRFAPDGDVELARNFSITFNQPMVAVGSHEGSARSVGGTQSAELPIRIAPAVRGRFRWVGARTLLFEPETRFAMATDFRVTVGAEARSISGRALGEPKEFQFSTPPPRLIGSLPTGQSVPLDPVMVLVFDQRIEPEEAVKSIRLEAAGRSRAIRLADAFERRRSAAVVALLDELAKRGMSDRALVFVAEQPLPREREVVIRVVKGFPSGEGKKTTEEEQTARFRTFSRLRIEDAHCAFGRCVPGSPLTIRLNNVLDSSAFDPSSIRVEPTPRFLEIELHGAAIQLSGETEGRTEYRVTLPDSLKDVHGQTLGEEVVQRFAIGEAEPIVHAEAGLVVLDPRKKRPSYEIATVNVDAIDVEVFRVGPSDYGEYLARPHPSGRSRELSQVGTRVLKDRIETKGEKDRVAWTSLDLSEAMRDGVGHALVRVKPAKWAHEHGPLVEAWVTSTRLGVDAFSDEGEILVFVSDLLEGRGIGDAELSLGRTGEKATTDTHGLARLASPDAKQAGEWLIVSRGADSAIVPLSPAHLYPAARRADGTISRRLLLAHLFTDRGVYRPGERVSIKGIVRAVDFGKRGDVEKEAPSLRALRYRLLDAFGNEIAEGKVEVNARGAFDLTVDLPEPMTHGYARAQFEPLDGELMPSGMSVGFTVQSFRTPTFEVKVRPSASTRLIGETAELKASASYYAGGALRHSEVRWDLSISDAYFAPPKHDGFHFGRERRWPQPIVLASDAPFASAQRASFVGQTDASGEHRLLMELEGVSPPFSKSVVASATVEDRDRQAHSGSATFIVHPAAAHLGLRPERNFVERGEPIFIDAIAVDESGKAIQGLEIEIRARLRKWDRAAESASLYEERCALRSGDAPVRCVLRPERGGLYQIVGDVRDAEGRLSRSELSVWVSGAPLLASERLEEEEVILVPEQERYSPGERARVLIQAPFEGGEGVFTLRRSGIVSHQKVTLDGRSAVVEFDVLEEHMPNVHLSVALTGAQPSIGNGSEEEGARDSANRPAFARGALQLEIDTAARALSVEIAPENAELSPGGRAGLSLSVKDARGGPVEGAELTVLAVDEAVLALIGYRHEDPLKTFYPTRQEGVSEARSRRFIRIAEEARLSRTELAKRTAADMHAMPMLSMAESAVSAPAGDGAAGEAIAIRADFRPLAFWGPELTTDAEGKASVRFDLPDNLTRYRLVAIAAEGARFGIAESSLVTRLPLMLRASAPRFLSHGDRFELPVVVQNQTDQAIDAEIALRGTNLRFTGPHGSRVTIPANDRVELRFPAEATTAGSAAFEVALVSSDFTDAVRGVIPVYMPVTVEAFAHYGEIDGPGARVRFKRPEDAVSAYGGLEIALASTELASLRDTIVFFHRHPFSGTEPIASRLLSFAALRDLLTAFEAADSEGGFPNRGEYEARIQKDLEELKRRQRNDGGFDFWGGRDRLDPFVSVHVAHALIRAKAQGIDVDRGLHGRSLEFLRRVEEHLDALTVPAHRRAVIAYAIYARSLFGDHDVARARALLKEAGGPEEAGLELLGFLLPTLETGSDEAELRAIERHLTNRITETASAANFVERYEDAAKVVFSSSRRTDGLLLESLIRTERLSDLAPKLVRGLLSHRSRGDHLSTQENVFILLALEAYFREHEGVAPDFVGRVWIGDRFRGEHLFRGRSTERATLEITMRQLADEFASEEEITIQREGIGRLYYRIGMQYAPRGLSVGPANHGFDVERVYEAVDDPADVRREADGTYRIKAGARVKVRLTMVAENRRYHVALVDPLAAGFESLNPALSTTERPPSEDSRPGPILPLGEMRIAPPWNPAWYDHQNLRDEQTEAFSGFLPAGVHEYSYFIRATTPGTFTAAPARAFEMYAPETFGRSASDRVIIE